jgi:acetolactate synthase-1/2/3 large subunit
MKTKTYADYLCDWLVEEGYTHCFFVAGGNTMHLLNSSRSRFKCVPVVHEVAAAIAVEYFNETSTGNKAFALVTAGPGITNAITGIAGAWLESRELLIIGGQVKSSDLMTGGLRQRGIQEIDGVSLVAGVTKISRQLSSPISEGDFKKTIREGSSGKPGPVFLEVCLDVQGITDYVLAKEDVPVGNHLDSIAVDTSAMDKLVRLMHSAERPIILIGGGLKREASTEFHEFFSNLGFPIMTTWNGIDRFPSMHNLFWGRPNTWGQRSGNVLIQQSDLIIAIGTRLGIQQTGFNWKGFAPLANIVQVEIDKTEMDKKHPKVAIEFNCDAEDFLRSLAKLNLGIEHTQIAEWIDFGKKVRTLLPNSEAANSRSASHVNPFDFVEQLSEKLSTSDVIIPCSSGGAFTTMMQAFNQKSGQIIVSDKGLASMGYGLSGAIGAAYANPNKRVVLVEGDGGFAQNLQELGSAVVSGAALKIFIYSNNGYASIRMTQRNYFDGAYIGCDISTGLGLPDWVKLFQAYGIETIEMNSDSFTDPKFLAALNDSSIRAFLVPIDPEQTYFPKITSKVLMNGQMESNPLHLMTPDLTDEIQLAVFKYLEV